MYRSPLRIILSNLIKNGDKGILKDIVSQRCIVQISSAYSIQIRKQRIEQLPLSCLIGFQTTVYTFLRYVHIHGENPTYEYAGFTFNSIEFHLTIHLMLSNTRRSNCHTKEPQFAFWKRLIDHVLPFFNWRYNQLVNHMEQFPEFWNNT